MGQVVGDRVKANRQYLTNQNELALNALGFDSEVKLQDVRLISCCFDVSCNYQDRFLGSTRAIRESLETREATTKGVELDFRGKVSQLANSEFRGKVVGCKTHVLFRDTNKSKVSLTSTGLQFICEPRSSSSAGLVV